MDLNEAITKAFQCAQLLSSDVLQAYQAVNSIERPEGLSIGDKATLAYLGDVLNMARSLESKLAQIA